jgi:aspartyl-tRNA(Asn)/glutamyl-tRNA(Gln) amidotransferase subunit A
MPPKKISRRELLEGVALGSVTAFLGPLGCSVSDRPKITEVKDIWALDLAEAAAKIRARELSPVEVTQASLDRISEVDGKLNSFITVVAESALEQARAAEAAISRGEWLGPVHGIPIALKDNIDTAGIKTTAASAVFADRVPQKDAAVVTKLKSAGAVILGKLNMHEFAGGTTSAISNYGPVRNPWNLEHIAGGSSGGNGAAVAAGLCFGSVGTDTGGSIRIPAACCGIVGLKPTYDVVDTEGLVYVSRSFDHIGPMCRTVTDTALMFQAMTDHPAAHVSDAASPRLTASLRVGLLPSKVPYCDAEVEAEVQTVVSNAIDVIRSLVAEVRDAEIPMPELGDVIGFEEYSFHASTLESSPQLYDTRTRENILGGKKVGKAEYDRMLRELRKHRETIDGAFSDVDLVVLPTLSTLPLKIAEATDPFALNACTFAFSIGGLPAISVPCGFSQSGLPIGLLIGGPRFSEPKILALAAAYEKAAGWEKRRPSI